MEREKTRRKGGREEGSWRKRKLGKEGERERGREERGGRERMREEGE